jgi:hypothetical protein
MLFICAGCKNYKLSPDEKPCLGCCGTYDHPNYVAISDDAVKRKSRSKFTKGERITTLDELYKQEYIYWNDKVYHKGWFRMWQFKMAFDILYTGSGLYHAIKVVK